MWPPREVETKLKHQQTRGLISRVSSCHRHSSIYSFDSSPDFQSLQSPQTFQYWQLFWIWYTLTTLCLVHFCYTFLVHSLCFFGTLFVHFAWYTFCTLFWYIHYAFLVHFFGTFTTLFFGMLLLHLLVHFWYTLLQILLLHFYATCTTLSQVCQNCTKNVLKVYQKCIKKIYQSVPRV